MQWPVFLRKLVRRRRHRLAGHLDRVEPRIVAGWAADLADFGETLRVVLVADGVPVAVATAGIQRADLQSAGFGRGAHGYEFRIPSLTAHGAEHVEVFTLTERTARRVGLVDQDGVLRRARPFRETLRSAGAGIARIGERRLPPRRHVDLPAYARDGVGPITFLEVYDPLAYLERHIRVTGIQRVVAGLVEMSLAAPGRYPVFEFCTPSEGGDIVALPREAFRALLRKALDGHATQAELLAEIEAIHAAGRRATPEPGDRYVVTGAYWIIDEYGRTLQRLRLRGVRIGALIYDLIPITASRTVLPSTHEAVVERGFEVLSLCDFFLTISAFVERQLGQLLASETGRRPPTRAVLLPHELPGGPKADASSGAVHPRPYVLCVGTLEGRKNHLLLFNVWAALIRKHGADAVPDLVLVGKWGWLIDEFRAACEATGFLGGKIVVRHDVSDGELLALYRGCLFTTFPSFAEGWGLPVGESLAVGKLCVASHATSIPEVGGDFVDYIDPHDHLGAAEIFERAIFDDAHRATRERRIAATFRARTWEEMTDGFHAGIRDLAAQADGEVRKVPLLRSGVIYSLANLMRDVSSPWEYKAAKLALAEGWHELEGWGAWSSQPRATLRFFTDEPAGRTVAVTLRLRPPPGGGRPTVTLDGGREARAVELPGGAELDVEIDAETGEGGEVVVTVASPAEGARDEGLRRLHAGLSAFGFRRAPDM